MSTIKRRAFLETAAAASAFAALGPRPAAAAGGIKKALYVSMLPKETKDAAGVVRPLSYRDRFRMAKDAGFEGVEVGTIGEPDVAAEIKEAAAATGLRIHSVMNAAHWRSPLSSGDPEVVTKSVAGMETSLRNAKLWGAETVLLVPAVVNAETSLPGRLDAVAEGDPRAHPAARRRSSRSSSAIEEVWNKFLLSPLEFARYVDEFDSPWVKAYLDVGNVLFYGYPAGLDPHARQRASSACT